MKGLLLTTYVHIRVMGRSGSAWDDEGRRKNWEFSSWVLVLGQVAVRRAKRVRVVGSVDRKGF